MRAEPTTEELLRLTFEEVDDLTAAKGRFAIDMVARQAKRLVLSMLYLCDIHRYRQPKASEDAKAGLISIEEASKLLGVSRSWIYEHQTELPFVKRFPGGMRRVSVDELNSYLKGH